MYEVGLRVPVVPVVTKADTMTIREAGIYRSEVANKIANPMLKGQSRAYIQIGVPLTVEEARAREFGLYHSISPTGS